jgi:hypothetical protein
VLFGADADVASLRQAARLAVLPEPETAVPAADGLMAAVEALATAGRITEPRARAWAQLFNLRYRMLLGQLAHFLRLDQEVYTAGAGPQQGDRTARGLLLVGTFDEMRHLKKIAGKLVQLPKDAGGTVHAGPPFLPTGFAKAVTILEEAVRGFRIGLHGNFWAGKTRQSFVTTPVPFIGLTPLALDAGGAVVPDPEQAVLIDRITDTDPDNRMPRFRPPVPAPRIADREQWIRDGAPDDDPPGRVGVVLEPDPAEETAPPPVVLGFAADIVGLFRADVDRPSMLFAFDLHRFEHVRDNADAILTRLVDGTMPCDAPWPPERIALFQRWIDEGKLP